MALKEGSSENEDVLKFKLIEILYEKLVLNMIYEIPAGIQGPWLTNHMSSNFAND